MKALVVKQFGAPDVLKVEDVSIPEPNKGQVLIKIFSAGVNPVETYKRGGAYAPDLLPKLPWIPGTDGAGVIEKVGEGVTNFKVGDRVWLSDGVGTYAQYCLAPEFGAHALPSNVSFDQGAALYIPYATAYNAICQAAQVTPGAKATILIHGASGGVGQACLQISQHLGLNIIGTASTESGLAEIAKYGAKGFNHKEQGYIEKIVQSNGGKGPDVIIEMLANVNLGKDLSIIATNGVIVVVGNRGTVEINPRDLMRTRAKVTGVSLFTATPKEVKEIFAALYKGLVEGYLTPKVGKAYKLSEGAKAHIDIINPPDGAQGKITIHPWDL